MKRSKVSHEFPPLVYPDSEILILGSFPSVKSRAAKFFYGHPQNRFWRVLASVYGENVPEQAGEKKSLLKRHHVACYDVIESCSIIGSSDSTIRNVQPADLQTIIAQGRIHRVILNGKTAAKYFERYHKRWDSQAIPVFQAPSTSPANAATSLETLIQLWRPLLTQE
jgi:double-stranded uracil-DNA glycosylase